jgi:N-acetylmuramoyl-L-alanine amidase
MALAACAMLVGACHSNASSRTTHTPSRTAPRARRPTPAKLTTTSTFLARPPRMTSTTAPAQPLFGRTIALDPGHNGGPVPPGMVDVGNGITHPCDSRGTANYTGLTESALNLDVALRMRAMLEGLGATVMMTRTTNDGSGPCIDERVKMANRVGVDVGLSIHADGVVGHANASGFHVAVPALIPGQTKVVVDASLRLALTLRDAYAAATGLVISNYAGSGGILPRTDLANTNLPNHPRVLFELGVLNNTVRGGHDDLAVLGTEVGRAAMARGLVTGIVNFLHADAAGR